MYQIWRFLLFLALRGFTLMRLFQVIFCIMCLSTLTLQASPPETYGDWRVECDSKACFAEGPSLESASDRAQRSLRLIFSAGTTEPELTLNRKDKTQLSAESRVRLHVGGAIVPFAQDGRAKIESSYSSIETVISRLQTEHQATLHLGHEEQIISLRGSSRAISKARKEASALSRAAVQSSRSKSVPLPDLLGVPDEPAQVAWHQEELGYFVARSSPTSQVDADLRVFTSECLIIPGFERPFAKSSSFEIRPDILQSRPLGYEIAGLITNGYQTAVIEFTTLGPPDEDGRLALHLIARKTTDNPYEFIGNGIFSFEIAQAFFLSAPSLKITFLAAIPVNSTSPEDVYSPFAQAPLEENGLLGQTLEFETSGLLEAINQRNDCL
ncbi:MAG: hypothetical protein AAGD04_04275 [Pseudomonadota bacterium]